MFAAALIITAGCAKAECKTSADCVAPKPCAIPKCEKSKCTAIQQINCCGNNVKESIENGKPGGKCTCPQDYGKCEGKGKVAIGSRTEDTRYLSYYCNADSQCVFGFDEKEVFPQNFLDSINDARGFFKVSSVLKYNTPFDISKGAFEITISLDDASKDLVLPVQLTRIKLFFNSQYGGAEQLIADQELSSMLNGVGEKARISAILNLGYRPKEAEESGSLRYSIDYVYTKRVLSGKVNGTNTYSNEIARAALAPPPKPIFFVGIG